MACNSHHIADFVTHIVDFVTSSINAHDIVFFFMLLVYRIKETFLLLFCYLLFCPIYQFNNFIKFIKYINLIISNLFCGVLNNSTCNISCLNKKYVLVLLQFSYVVFLASCFQLGLVGPWRAVRMLSILALGLLSHPPRLWLRMCDFVLWLRMCAGRLVLQVDIRDSYCGFIFRLWLCLKKGWGRMEREGEEKSFPPGYSGRAC